MSCADYIVVFLGWGFVLVGVLVLTCVLVVEKQRQKDAAEYEKNMQHGIGQTFTSVWKLPKK